MNHPQIPNFTRAARSNLQHPERIARYLIPIIFLLLGSIYSIRVPIFEASDELWHYPMVEVIGRTWTLPVQPLEPGTTSGPWRQEGSQQPLYYALGAVLTSWIDTSDMPQVRQPNPHVRAGEITPERDNVNLVIHHPDQEKAPWSGTVLAVHIVRILSVLLGVGSLILTWHLMRELFPSQAWIATIVTAVQAFTPMHLFISSSVNNDNLTIPLCTWALLLMVRRVKRPAEHQTTPLPLRQSLILGGVLGMTLLTKTSGLGLLPFVGATLAWEAWQRSPFTSWQDNLVQFSRDLALITVPAVAISGWWYHRNLRLYGDLLGWRAFEAVLGTRDVPASLGQLWSERQAFAAGYWGNFGGLNVPMAGWTYRLLNGLAIGAAAGLVVSFVRWLRDGKSLAQKIWPFAWSSLTAARALAWAWPIAIFVSWIRWATTTWSSQGRLIFPALPLWSLALVVGLSAWLPRRWKIYRAAPAGAFASFLFALSIVALPAWITPAYRPPQALTGAELPARYTQVDATFGETLTLVGYHLETDVVAPDDSVALELVWRAEQPTIDHHSIFIHLLGEGDRIIAQRDSLPGHGLLPTTQLTPGRLWTEQHILGLPRTAYAPDNLTVAVGFYETGTGARVLLDEPGMPQRDTIRFGEIQLIEAPESEGLGVRVGESIVLAGYNISDLVLSTGDELEVDLTWQCTGPVAYDYTVSVQIIDSRWQKAAQSDTWPLDGQRPTTSWSVGETITETRSLTIHPEAVPGAYDLRLTLYRATDEGKLEHLPISLRREDMPVKSLNLTVLRINE